MGVRPLGAEQFGVKQPLPLDVPVRLARIRQINLRPGGVEAWGSPVHADGRIYIPDRQGSTLVFAAGPRYQHLATNALGESTNASIAISGGDLFLRTHKHLWCIGANREAENKQ